jgi:hypothetical protein
MPRIYIGGSAPAQTTVTTPGSYTVDVVAFTADPEATFVGPGTYNLDVKASLFASYTLVATNGAVVNVTSDAELLTTTNLVIDGASTISFDEKYSALSAVTADFTGGGGGTLILPPGKFMFADALPVVSGFGAGDHIDFGAPIDPQDKIVYSPEGAGTGLLTLQDPSGNTLGSVTLIGSYNPSNFTLGTATDGTGEIDFACFLRGTRVMTPAGEVPVESLQAGDAVMTLEHGAATVQAVRLRGFAAGATSAKLLPVCIAAGALAEGVPHRDLWVSPDHSMYLDGVLVPAQLLVNGQSITQPARASAIEYFHVEIAPHDVLIAEGAATESYLDIGNRGHFGTAGTVSMLPVSDPKSWEDACAPLVLAGPQLAAITARLAGRAAALKQEPALASAA